jgi:hypothetical protein
MSTSTWRELEQRSAHWGTSQPPVTGALWLALMKFSSGEWNVSTAECDALLAYGLIRKEGEHMVLTPYARQVLAQSA